MTQKVYFTYILRCSDGTYYTGKTNNLEKRIRQHNGEITGGAKYTRIRRPILLHYWEEHTTHLTACQREIYIKHLSHKAKNKLNILI